MVDPNEGKKNENTIRKRQYQYNRNVDTSATTENDSSFCNFYCITVENNDFLYFVSPFLFLFNNYMPYNNLFIMFLSSHIHTLKRRNE